MRKKRVLILLLAFSMVLSTLPSFAADGAAAEGSGTTTEAAEKSSEAASSEKTEAANAPSAAKEETQGETAPEKDAAATAPGETRESSGAWTAEDFTYGNAEKLIYGCDYSRQFTVSGKVVTGFSASGEEKLKTNKDLVLPRKDDQGNVLVGVGGGAFKEKGLTSVKFPTGMMVPYNDTVTNFVTKRGNFIIFEGAFAKNELTEVTFPEGVIGILANSFQDNKIKTVNLPRTIWWIENAAFARNEITKVNFPATCDFQMELHGMPFSFNKIRSVRLPDFTEVVNKFAFSQNPGMAEIPAEAPATIKTYKDPKTGETQTAGVVYMYTDNPQLLDKQRIHTIDRPIESQHSWCQKLIVNDGTSGTENVDATVWKASDFTYSGAVVTGLSPSGIAKRKINRHLVLPSVSSEGVWLTEIAGTENANGLFASEDEKFDTVEMPIGIAKIGKKAFMNNGLKHVALPAQLQEIGDTAFQNNSLDAVILPDTLTSLGAGAFATNPEIEVISLPRNPKLTEIPAAAFGCSDKHHWMSKLTEIEIPDTITKIGQRAFAGNNFHHIAIPASVKEIGAYSFSTKNYLNDPCTLELREGLETIGDNAFRNKSIEELDLPESVKGLPVNTFRKQSTTLDAQGNPVTTDGSVTKVRVTSKAQYGDATNFPKSKYHKLYLSASKEWTAEDFTYGEMTDIALYPGNDNGNVLNETKWVVTGLTEDGKEKLKKNQNLVIPEKDPEGKVVQGVGNNAFNTSDKNSGVYGLGVKVKTVSFPDGVKTANNGKWDAKVTERGDFFIGQKAFYGNELRNLTLPEGVIFVDRNAFGMNKLESVTFPRTIMTIAAGAFADASKIKEDFNVIKSVSFPEETDFPLSIQTTAFAFNMIESVALPRNTLMVHKTAFVANQGKEEVVGASTAAEKISGLVYLYLDTTETPSALIAHVENSGNMSKVQKLVQGKEPGVDAPWSLSDFTFDASGTTVTGLTDQGKAKLKKNPALIIPDKNAAGEAIVAIGDGQRAAAASDANPLVGTFGYREKAADDTVRYVVPTSVKFPAKLAKIGTAAFSVPAGSEQTGLTEIVFPETLKEIGASAFQNVMLSELEIPDTVTTLGDGAFAGNEHNKVKIEKLMLPKSLTAIPNAAFNSQAIKEVVVPDSVTEIGSNAFAGNYCEKLTLPNSVTSIGRLAFANHALTEVTIPDSVKSIGASAFRSWTESKPRTLKKLVLGKGVESIGSLAFGGSLLPEVEIPAALVKIDKNAFSGNSVNGKSQKVELLTSVQEQAEGKGAYTGLVTDSGSIVGHTIVYDKLAGSGWTYDDFTYSLDGKTITGWSPSGQEKRKTNHHLVLPDTAERGGIVQITAIGDRAFRIPDDEVYIGKYDATSPNGMQTAVLPKSLETIGEMAFEYNNLQEMDFDHAAALKNIGKSAFHGNHLRKVQLTDAVTSIGEGAFSMNNIVDLRLPKNSAYDKIEQGTFSMNIRMSEIEIPETIKEIGKMAFAGARLETLDIPNSVEKIGEKAFHLHHLTELTIPGTVKEIGESAFEGTYKAATLKKLVLGEGIGHIGRHAFKEGLIEEAALPHSLKTMGEEPFLNNTGQTVEGKGEHIVILTTEEPAHLAFNDGAKTHLVRLNAKEYSFTEGAGQTWYKGSGKSADFRVSASKEDRKTYGNFREVKIDGKTVSASEYEKREGSVILSFKPDYMEKLAGGEHTIAVSFSDGTATAKFRVATKDAGSGNNGNGKTGNRIAKTAKTGDHGALPWNAGLLLFTAVILIAGARIRKRAQR